MNIWTTISLVLALIFAIISLIFALLKEKGAILISGFNSLSKKEREKYDQNRMSLDMRNSFFLWFIILLLGAITSYFINSFFALLALVIWIILFIKDVHLDVDKAFGKYKKQ